MCAGGEGTGPTCIRNAKDEKGEIAEGSLLLTYPSSIQQFQFIALMSKKSHSFESLR